MGIVEQLRKAPLNVTQLSKALGQDQSMISHNLRPLVKCGFVFVEKRWRERVYSLNKETMRPLFKVIDNHIMKYCPRGGKCER